MNEKEARCSTPQEVFATPEGAARWVNQKNDELIHQESWRGNHGWRARSTGLNFKDE